MFSPEGLDGRALGKIPDPDSFIFAARDDKLVFWVEQGGRNVVEVASTRINFPSLGLAHPPDFDLPVVSSRNDKRQRVVEHRVVDSTVVTFQHVLHSREIVESIKGSRCRIRSAFSKTGDIPNSDGLIH